MGSIHLLGAKKARVVLVFDMPAGGDPNTIAQGILGSVTVGLGVVGVLKFTTVQVIPADADPLTFNVDSKTN